MVKRSRYLTFAIWCDWPRRLLCLELAFALRTDHQPGKIGCHWLCDARTELHTGHDCFCMLVLPGKTLCLLPLS